MDWRAARPGGILTVTGSAAEILWVAETVAEHTDAVVRDLLSMGLHRRDIGTDKCSVGEFTAMLMASPPNSAVRHFVIDKCWSPEAHLLANLGEQYAGVLRLGSRYPRPGVESEAAKPAPSPVDPVTGAPRMTPMTLDEFKARRARDKASTTELASTEKRLA